MVAMCRRWGHLLVLALVLPIALSSALPVYARIAGGPTPHVCHCEVRGGHSMCGCPICNPDRDDLQINEVSLRGKCGDDDEVFGAVLGSAVAPPPGVTIVPPDLAGETAPAVSPRLELVFLTPPTPPPRFALS
jgi:hypothetical protein